MPANFKRLLPILLIMVVVLFIVPQLTKKKTASGPNAGARATQTIDAVNLIEKGQQAYRATNGSFTSHLSDLLKPGSPLAGYLATGMTVRIDAASDGRQYIAEVASDVLRFVRAGGVDGKVIAQSCMVLKRSKGVACPLTVPAPAK